MEPGVRAVKVPSVGGGPSVRTVLLVVLVALGLAYVKPWGSGDDPPGPAASGPPGVPGGGFGAPRRVSPPSSPTTEDRRRTAEELVATFCLEPSGWRVFSTQEFGGRQVRSWTAAEPIALADGPDDPRIPLIPVISRAVLTLGYCTPVAGPERPPGPTVTTIFQRGVPGLTRTTEPVDIRRLLPRLASSPFGAVYEAPRAGGTASGWQTGTWIFEITSEQGFERWFGAAVEVIPPLPTPSAAAQPADARP